MSIMGIVDVDEIMGNIFADYEDKAKEIADK